MGTIISEVDYLNNTVWCKLAPSKFGVGVFSIRDIAKGTKLTDWDRNHLEKPNIYELSEKEFMFLVKPIRDLILDKTTYSLHNIILRFISPNSECYLQDFCNHSDKPNVDKWFVANRDIKSGEEIFEDYNEFAKELHQLSKEHYNFL